MLALHNTRMLNVHELKAQDLHGLSPSSLAEVAAQMLQRISEQSKQIAAQAQAIKMGYDQVVYLDAAERRWVEELGGMNLFFVFEDGSLQTPPLGGTILPGITRDALITLARDEGLTVREEPYAIDQWRADANSGRLTESFACGTAAVVTPVGSVTSREGKFTIGAGGPGQTTQRLRDRLVGIQRGTAADPYGWVQRID